MPSNHLILCRLLLPPSIFPSIGVFSNESVLCISQSVQSLRCVWLCDPMDCSTPGFPVHHQLPKLAQTHVHRVNDAIQLSHPLSSPSPPAFSLSQHQGFFLMSQFFASGGQSIGASVSASVLPMNIHWLVLSRVFSNTTVQNHQFFSALCSLWFNSYIHTWPLKKP